MIDLILLAAGSGKRMKSSTNKQFLKIDDKPILIHSLEKFYNHKNIDRIILAVKADEEKYVRCLLDKYGFEGIYLVYGGKERQDSIFNCLNYIKYLGHNLTHNRSSIKSQIMSSDKEPALGINEDIHIVLVHDGARPFISESTIDTCIKETLVHKATCLAVPAKDTIKLADKDLNIVDTPDRKYLWCAQTPQTFDFDLLLRAYENAYTNKLSVTDDASIVEAYCHPVKIIKGNYDNIKITTPEDIGYADYIAQKYK